MCFAESGRHEEPCRQTAVRFLPVGGVCLGWGCVAYPPQRYTWVLCKALQCWMASPTSMFLLLVLIVCFVLIARYVPGASVVHQEPKEPPKEKRPEEKENKHGSALIILPHTMHALTSEIDGDLLRPIPRRPELFSSRCIATFVRTTLMMR